MNNTSTGATAAAHAAFLLSHISSSAPHPTHTQTVQACTRFAWTAGGTVGTTGLPINMLAPQQSGSSSLSSSGVPLLRSPGLKIVFHWPVPASSSVASELRRWEAILNGGDNAMDPVALIGESALGSAAKLPSSAAHSPAMTGIAGPTGATAVSAAAQSAAAAALPSLPAPAVSTGARWAVVVENCFLLPRAGTPAPAAGSAAAASGPAAAAASKDHKLFRVRASFGGSLGPPSSWLLTHNLILEGSAAMDRWIDGLAPAVGSTAASLQSASGSSTATASGTAVGSDGTASGAPSLLQVRSQVAFSGDEWTLGDFIVRLATLKEGSKQRAVLVMEIENTACVSPAPDNLRTLYEMAVRLGVPPTAALHQPQELTWKALGDFGLSATNYTLAHSALQYLFLVTSLRDTAAATAQAP